MTEETELPGGWRKMDSDEQHSTISWFITGYTNDSDEQVLVWKGDGLGSIESHLGNDIPGDAMFIIEIFEDDELVREKFASEEEEAIDIALQEADIISEFKLIERAMRGEIIEYEVHGETVSYFIHAGQDVIKLEYEIESAEIVEDYTPFQ